MRTKFHIIKLNKPLVKKNFVFFIINKYGKLDYCLIFLNSFLFIILLRKVRINFDKKKNRCNKYV